MASGNGSHSARPSQVRVLVVDGRALVGELLSQEIENSPSFELMGCVEGLEPALELLAEQPCDVVLFGAGAVGVEAHEFVSAVKKACAQASVMVLVMREGDELAFSAIAAGACCSVTLDTPDLELFRRIRSARDGHVLLPAGFVKKLIAGSEPLTKRKKSSCLSDAELEVLALTRRGLNHADVARRLGLSNSAVKELLVSLYRKVFLSGATMEDLSLTA